MLLRSDAYGTRVGLRVAAVDVDALRGFLPFWWVDTADDATPDLVFDVPVVAGARSVVAELELAVAERAEGLVFVHAAVVAAGGRALLLPGPSYAGKSTLVDALVRAGATYCSDEYAPLGPDGVVHPYPRPLVLRDAAGVRVATVGGGVAAAPPVERPLPVAAVAVVRYRDGARYRPRSLTTGAGVLALLENTVCARSRPGEALTAATAVAAGARMVVGDRGAAADAAGPLLALLSG